MPKQKIILGSSSLNKQKAVEVVFEQVFGVTFEVITEEVSSQVAEAPHDQETYQGALNRAKSLSTANDRIAVGIESGIASRYGMMFEEAWAVIILDSVQYAGYSSGLMLPFELVQLMRTGLTHDRAIKLLDKQSTVKTKDTWAVYTSNVLSRQVSLEEAVRNAAVQINRDLILGGKR